MSQTGTVKFFNATKGFGFISGNGDDVFVHSSSVQGNPLQEGDEVTYDSEFNQQKQKYQAVNVSGGTGSDQGGGYGKGKGKGKYGGGQYY